MMKDQCQACFAKIKNSETHFGTYGNFCPSCSRRAWDLAQTRAHIYSLERKIEKLKKTKITIENVESWEETKDRAEKSKKFEEEYLKKLIKECRQYAEVL